MWLTNKLLTMGDKLPKEAYGSFVVTLLQGKALETIEHLQPEEYTEDWWREGASASPGQEIPRQGRYG